MKFLTDFLNRLRSPKRLEIPPAGTAPNPKPLDAGPVLEQLAKVVDELGEIVEQLAQKTPQQALQEHSLQNTTFSQVEMLKDRAFRERVTQGLPLRRVGDPARFEKVILD